MKLAADAPVRLLSSNQELYRELVAVRDANPMGFDRKYPFYRKLLTNAVFADSTNAVFADSMIARWQLDKQRFEYYHPLLYRMIDRIPPNIPIIPPAPIHNSSTPEPASGLLMIMGAADLTIGLGCRARALHRSAHAS